MTPKTQSGPSGQANSLRTRWNRSIALVAVVIFFGASANFLGSRLLVETFRDSATNVELASSSSVQLRADLISNAIVAASPTSDQQRAQATATQRSLRSSFEQVLDREANVQARQYLVRSFDEVAGADGRDRAGDP